MIENSGGEDKVRLMADILIGLYLFLAFAGYFAMLVATRIARIRDLLGL